MSHHLSQSVVQFEGQTWMSRWYTWGFNQTSICKMSEPILRHIYQCLPWQSMTWTRNIARKLEQNIFYVRYAHKSFKLSQIQYVNGSYNSVKPGGVTRESSKLEVGRKSRVFHWSQKYNIIKLLPGNQWSQ